jgi:alpha-L-rhamnosidase
MLLTPMAHAQGKWGKSDVVPTHLRCEYRENPLGIDAEKPRLSWIIADLKSEISNPKFEMPRGQKQTAYQILVASSEELLKNDKGDLWDSGKVASDQSIQVEYAGKPLASRQQCFWKVKTWTLSTLNPEPRTLNPSASDWSNPALWSMGLLKPEDWQAKWIKAGGDTSPWLRKEFTLAAAPERATAFVNVKGYYELYVNGKKVSDDVLAPAVSVYKKRSLYNTYDISKYLRPGPNCVGVWLGLALCFRGDTVPLARVQLDLSVDGQRVVVGTDPTWTCMPSTHGEFRWSWCGNGREHIDARRDIPGWSEPGCTAGKWALVEETAEPGGVATAQFCPPNRITKTIPIVSCTELRPKTWELDFGTNLTGWLRLRLPQLESGRQVTIRFADKRLRSAQEEVTPVRTYEPPPGTWKTDTAKGTVGYLTYNQEAVFISAGKPGEQFCNKFNYNGFRYAIVEGLPAQPAAGDAEALMIESDLESAGTFECSNDLLNRILQVSAWTLRCLNLGGYMVDCPHRERMGYGDGQSAIDAHVMTRNAAAFYGKWALDWLDDQDPTTGKSGQYVPKNIDDPSCWFSWGGMVDVMPWKAYVYYGDRRILQRAYEPMVRYPSVYIESFYKDGVHRTGGDPGCDWVAPAYGMRGPPGTELFANCYRAYLFDLLAKSADVLGRTEDARRHRAKSDDLKNLIHAAFYKADEKLYVVDEQLNQSMPLMLGIVPEPLRETVKKKLEDITLVKNKGHLDTGMLGTYFLFQYLQDSGRNDLAYTMATQKDFPGWGCLLSQGATTFGEQWDGYWSQIHSCYVGIGSWFYQGLAGIRPDEAGPGFKKIIIKPAVVGDLTWVKCSYDSIHGRIVSNWKREGDQLTMEVTIPTNTTATVYVPAKDAAGVTESGKPAAKADGVKFLRMENGAAVYEAGAGQYSFKSDI